MGDKMERIEENLTITKDKLSQDIDYLKTIPTITAYYLGKEDAIKEIEIELQKRKCLIMSEDELQKRLDENTVRTIERIKRLGETKWKNTQE